MKFLTQKSRCSVCTISILYIKQETLWVEGHFWPKEHYLNKLGSGLLDDATYQVSRLYALLEQRFFHVFPIYNYVTPTAGPFLKNEKNLVDATYQISRLHAP